MRISDVAFHSVIYKIADHSFVYQVWQDVTNKMNRVWYFTNQFYFSDLLELATCINRSSMPLRTKTKKKRALHSLPI